MKTPPLNQSTLVSGSQKNFVSMIAWHSWKNTNRDYAWFGVTMHAEQLSCTPSIVLISILVCDFCLKKDEVILTTVSRMPNLFAAFVKKSQKNLVFAVWETISNTLVFKSTGKVLTIKKRIYVCTYYGHKLKQICSDCFSIHAYNLQYNKNGSVL